MHKGTFTVGSDSYTSQNMDVFQIEVLAAGAVLLLIIIIFLSRRNRGAGICLVDLTYSVHF